MAVVSISNLLEAGVHFGHQTKRWNPKMKEYIFTTRDDIYIIDLQKTLACMEEAYAAISEIAKNGGTFLFVGTKKQAQEAALENATRSNSYYVTQRWLGGTLTNFRTIQKSIKKLVDIEEMEANETITRYTKKEQALLLKQKDKLENFLGGIKEMKKLPDALFIVDPLEEHNAVAEARKLGIPVFALIDTNADPTLVDYPIPSNDDAVRSIKLMVSVVADAIVEAKGGVLEVAHQEDETVEDITMKDVIINVEAQAAEYERKKRQRFEERRAQMAQQRGNGKYNGERRVFRRDNRNTKAEGENAETTAAPAEAKEAK